MKIEKIELRHIKMELATPFETSMGVERFEEHVIVRIDAEGLTGWGECVVEPLPLYSSETVKTAWFILEEGIIPSLLGKNFTSVNDAMNYSNHFRGHRMAKAGVECALWDLLSKSKNLSLSKILGGTKKEVETGVSIGIHSSPEELVETIGLFLEKGYRRIKIKIAPGKDVEFVRRVREIYPDIPFQVDANSAYNLMDAAIFKVLDEFNLLMIEQPLSYDDVYEHSLLQKEINTPLCLDESIHSLLDAKAALSLGSCRIINIKPGRVGGFNESILIHDYCKNQNIPVWCGGMLESGIGRAGNIALASLSNFLLPGDISENERYYNEDIVEPLFRLSENGTIKVPEKPGIGVEVSEKALEKVTSFKKEFRQ